METEATAQSEFLLIHPKVPPTPEAGDPYRGQDKPASFFHPDKNTEFIFRGGGKVPSKEDTKGSC